MSFKSVAKASFIFTRNKLAIFCYCFFSAIVVLEDTSPTLQAEWPSIECNSNCKMHLLLFHVLYHPPHTYLPASFAWDFEAPETVASATAKMQYPPPAPFALCLLSTPYHLSGRFACPNSGVTSPDQQNGAQSYDRSADCCACDSKLFFVGQNCRF